MLITAGWDRSVRYWDLRQPNPVHVQQLPERAYAMDATFPVLVVGLGSADRKIQVSGLLAVTRPRPCPPYGAGSCAVLCTRHP